MSGSGAGKQGDKTTDFVAEAVPAGKYLVNPYEDWAAGEGVPVLTGRVIDLMTTDVRAWPRFDCAGAIAHVDGRCDFLTVFLHEIAPGKAAAPQRHVYDELVVVLAGTGETQIEFAGGTQIAPWRPGTVLGPPANARYRHRNTGAVPARIACFNDMRYLLSLSRSERFIFENPIEGVRPSGSDTRHQLVQVGGSGRDSGPIQLGSGTIGADRLELAAATLGHVDGVRPGGSDTRQPARRQMQGAHLLGLGSEGRTLSWREGASAGSETETRWRHGIVIGLPGMHFHRHAAAGTATARALDIQLGSALFPISRSRRNHYGDKSVYASGSAEIP